MSKRPAEAILASHEEADPESAAKKTRLGDSSRSGSPVTVQSRIDDEEDDYMNMTFEATEALTKKPESAIQRRARQKRENIERSTNQKTKAQLRGEEDARCEEALATQLDESNKGFRMMQKLGFKAGDALGQAEMAGRTEPIAVDLKMGRGGIGADAEKKRKVREEVAQREKNEGIKRQKVAETETEYRERVVRERMDQEKERQWFGAMKICEELAEKDGGLNGEGSGRVAEDGEREQKGQQQGQTPASEPLRIIPVEYRELIRSRIARDRDKREQQLREELRETGGRVSSSYYDKAQEHDHQSLLEEVEVEQEDAELDEYNGLAPSDRLDRVIAYLRNEHRYCFWCKTQYENAEAMGEMCPGLTEDDHP